MDLGLQGRHSARSEGMGCWMLDTGCWILDAGYWMLDAGYWMLDTGSWIVILSKAMESRRCAPARIDRYIKSYFWNYWRSGGFAVVTR